MTILTMQRASALLLCALLTLSLAACGDEPETASAKELEAARAETQEALDELGALRERLDELESELRSSIESAAEETSKLASDLKDATSELKSSLKEIRSASDSAAASAQSAASEVAAVARRLTVLEDRYNFHLKRYHGGG